MTNLKLWYGAHKQEVLIVIALVLVATTSFGLGYLIAEDSNRAPIIIEKNIK